MPALLRRAIDRLAQRYLPEKTEEVEERVSTARKRLKEEVDDLLMDLTKKRKANGHGDLH